MKSSLSWLGALMMSCCAVSQATDVLHFTARRIESPLLVADDVRVALRPAAAGNAAITVTARRIAFAGALGEYSAPRLACANATLNGPRPACRRGSFATRTGPLGPMQLETDLTYDLDRQRLQLEGRRWALAAGRANLTATVDTRSWRARLSAVGMQATPLRQAVRAYATLPADIETSGSFDFDASLAGLGGAATAQWQFRGQKVGFANPDATVAGENLAFVASGTLEWPRTGNRVRQTMRITGTAGQALLGPALLDFAANPLAFDGHGYVDGNLLRFETLSVRQDKLLEAVGDLQLRLEPEFALDNGMLRVQRLQFPAAYTSFVQLGAAATVFGDLETSGIASGAVRIASGGVGGVDLTLAGLDLLDRKGKFRMRNLRGEVHWGAAGGAADPASSRLSWDEGGSYGLSGGAARIEFLAQGRGFRLTAPARIPIFDGGVRIDVLEVEDVGLDSMRASFEGEILPIGMPQLSRAFGWPELAGTLGGNIPRVDYRDKVMSFGGDVVARVFGGRIVGSHMRLQDPLGPWPRFFADVQLENLDLAMVTDTFEIGSITGRLEGAIMGMELFNWSPVKFDASLRTPPGDRSLHRISARAVGTLSDIGGSGGGGFARLQQGVLSFFDEYDYDRIGIRCQLANDTCTMSGIERAGMGYYILQGKGLPRINIIGNAGRVNWPALVNQIAEAMSNSGENIKVDR